MTTEAHLKRLADETSKIYATEQLQFDHSVLDDKKLLTRPSFKLIRDIVKELMTGTRILRDVFGPADFDPKRRGSMAAASSSRTARVEFVQKLIDFVAKNKHPAQGCVASKIVAGSDPVKTNELLQNLARVALIKLQERQQPIRATATVARTTRQSSSPRQQPPSASRKRSSSSQRVENKAPTDSPSSRKASAQGQDLEQKEEIVAAEHSHRTIGEKVNGTPEAAARQEDILPAKTDQPITDNVDHLIEDLKKLGPKLEEIAILDEHLREKLGKSSARKLP